MKKTRDKLIKRSLAILLAILMIWVAMPSEPLQILAEGGNSSAENEEQNTFGIIVQDQDGNALQGAKVKLQTGDPEGLIEKDTDDSGRVEITPGDVAHIFQENEGGSEEGVEGESTEVESTEADGDEKTVDAVLTVSMTDYETHSQTVTLTKNGLGEDVSVVLSKEQVTVACFENENADISLNGEDVTTVTVDKGADVVVKITPHEGCYIKELSIGEDVADPPEKGQAYEKTIKADKDITISVTAVQQYTVTIRYDSEKGQVVTTPECDGGTVIVDKDGNVAVTAMPNEHYHVSKVLINDVPDDTVTGGNYAMGQTYEKQLTADQDYTVEITFALNQYRITSVSSEHGTVSVEREVVDYNESVAVTIQPDSGYTVTSVKVNGQPQELDDSGTGFTLLNIAEDQTIEVEFTEISKVSRDELQIQGLDRALRSDETTGLYVYGEDISVTFETEMQGIELYCSDGTKYGARDEQTVTINAAASIVKVCLYGKMGDEMRYEWHEVEGITGTSPLRIVEDTDKPKVTLTPSAANAYGYYNSDVTVTVGVEDPGDYSGLYSVEYWVMNGNKETKREKLYPDKAGSSVDPTHEDSIPVNAQDNNSDNVTVYVKAVDRAGNEYTEMAKLKINSTKPQISVAIDGTLAKGASSGKYNKVRTATVTYIDRADTFDREAAEKGIEIQGTDASGNAVAIDKNSMISWTDNGNQHIASICFDIDANYTWSISYSNKADLSAEHITAQGDNVYSFSVDTAVPDAEITLDHSVWDRILSVVTLGLYKNYDVTAEVTASDVTTGIDSILYYKFVGDTGLTEQQLNTLYEQGEFQQEKITVNENEKFVVYARIADMAGNVRYISTDWIVRDTSDGRIEISSPQANEHGYYNGNVELSVFVSDMVDADNAYSGIKTITYVVENDGQITQEGTLASFDVASPTYDQLWSEWNGTITVDAGKNNSDHVKVTVKVRDNAGNEYENAAALKIDITAPVIDVAYSNNSADSGRYFNGDRVATIVITERSFDPDDVRVTITNTDGVIPSVSSWSRSGGSGNQDDTQWRASVVYSADGDYTFSIDYTDSADNRCEAVRYGNSAVPTEFTIDKTVPAVSVSYSNNDARNDKYFADARTATVTVQEHNFDVNRVTFTQTASLNGTAITVPAASWSVNGDTHTATIIFNEDGDYTFDIAVSDMAGNRNQGVSYGGSAAGQDFVIDKSIEKPVIGGVENGKAYKGDVIPTITFEDVNYETYEVRLVRTRMAEKNVDVTDKFIHSVSEQAQGGSGSYDTFEKVEENDGIYTLSVKMTDKAGNEESEEVTFTVNRFGSVYVYSDYLISLIKDGGQYITVTGNNDAAITDNLVITEYNADRLLENSLDILVTRDGEVVAADYTTNPSAINASANVGDSGWFEYVYTINKDNFLEDGAYKLTISSEDATENTSVSVPENSTDTRGNKVVDQMNFTVDTTAPEIRNVVGLDQAIVNAQNLTVKYTVVDAGGLQSIDVFVNQEPLDPVTDFEGNPNSYSGEFTLGESADAQSVRIRVTDCAGNVTDTDTVENGEGTVGEFVFHNLVTVSTNAFVRWYANKPLFFGTIGGGGALCAAGISLTWFRRRRKLHHNARA